MSLEVKCACGAVNKAEKKDGFMFDSLTYNCSNCGYETESTGWAYDEALKIIENNIQEEKIRRRKIYYDHTF